MRFRLIVGTFLLCLAATVGSILAQSTMTVDRLVEFMRSSIKQKEKDADVAGYVRSVKLSQKLDDKVIEELRSEGLGPKTVAALRTLSAASASLPVAEAKSAAPPVARPEEPAPPEAQQKKILEAARDYALNYSQSLPNFICAQSTKRYSGDRMYDHVLAKLTFFEQHEKYDTISVNDKVTNTPYEKLGGSISTGEFGSMLRGIFDPQTDAQFAWSAWRTIHGDRKAYVFKFSVDQPHSRWQIEDRESNQKISPAYTGFVWIDVKDNSVLAFTMKAVDMPPTFPITSADTRLDYDKVDISGSAHVLPTKAVMHMMSGRNDQRNEITFHNYHQYTADTSLTFSDTEPDATPPPDTKPKK